MTILTSPPLIVLALIIILAIAAIPAYKIKKEEYKKTGKHPKGHYVWLGLAFGIPLGIPFGVAMGNIALGFGFGLPIGLVIGTALEKKYASQLRDLTPAEKEMQKKTATIMLVMVALGLLVFAVFGYMALKQQPSTSDQSEDTQVSESSMTSEQALAIAGNDSECSDVGIPGGEPFYNENSKTWWFDLERMPELEKDGCNPACVVFAETEAVEVNWRCTGLIQPEDDGEVVADTVEDTAGFAPYDSGVTGTVLLGPTCPVMREGDDSCADKPYATTIQVIALSSPSGAPFATVDSDENGKFTSILPPGEYALQPISGKPLPFCETKNITIAPSTIIEVDLSCDSGIR